MREALLKGRNLGFHICIQSVTTRHSSETYEEAPPSHRYILGKGRVSWTSLMGPGYFFRSLDHTLRTTGIEQNGLISFPSSPHFVHMPTDLLWPCRDQSMQ